MALSAHGDSNYRLLWKLAGTAARIGDSQNDLLRKLAGDLAKEGDSDNDLLRKLVGADARRGDTNHRLLVKLAGAYAASFDSDNDLLRKILDNDLLNPVPDVVTPDAPVAQAASDILEEQFTANWSASTGATGYYLDVATDAAFTALVVDNLDVGDVLTDIVAGLTNDTDYFYRVRAYNSAGTSASSNTVTLTTALSIPDAPVATDATDLTSSSFTANWNASTGATNYFLDVATDAGFTSLVVDNVDQGSSLSASVGSLSASTDYYYRVRASNSAGTSASSNTINAETAGEIPLTGLVLWLKNENLNGFNDGDGIPSWSDNSGYGSDATQSTGARQPVYQTNELNGRPIARFTAANSHFLNLPSGLFPGGETGAEMFVVVKLANDPPASSGVAGCWRIAGSGDVDFYPFNVDSQVYYGFCSTARKTCGNPTPSLAAWHLHNVLSQDNLWTLLLNGTQQFTTATNTFTTAASGTMGSTRKVGQAGDSSSYLNGDVAEVIVYGRVLDAGERTTVKAYIAAKFGLTIA